MSGSANRPTRISVHWLRSIVLAAILLGPGCGLILDFSDPPRGNEIECLVTVVNPEGIEVDISNITHPDFVEAVPSFRGGGGFGSSPSSTTRPIRPYYTCDSGCSGGCPVTDAAAAEADWRRYINQRISEVASGGESDSPFFVHAGPWCVKEEDDGASTLRCRETSRLTETPACPPAVTAGPLPGCPGGTPTGTCVEVECLGAPCTEIVFPETPFGGSMAETVTVRNCGSADDDSIGVMLDEAGAIIPTRMVADFRIEDDPAQPCLPRNPMEELDGRVLTLPSFDPFESECRFDVVFEPLSGMKHEGELVFNTTPVSPVRIRLEGDGAAGSLTETLPDVACINNLVGSCGDVRIFDVTNPGPGAVTVTDAFFDAGSAANFRILAPTTFPFTIPPMGSVEFRVQWCMGGPDQIEGGLTILSNADPPYEEQKFEFQRTPCPPGS